MFNEGIDPKYYWNVTFGETSLSQARQKAREAEVKLKMHQVATSMLSYPMPLPPTPPISPTTQQVRAAPQGTVTAMETETQDEPMPDTNINSLKRSFQSTKDDDEPPKKRGTSVDHNFLSDYQQRRSKDRQEGRFFKCHRQGHTQ